MVEAKKTKTGISVEEMAKRELDLVGPENVVRVRVKVRWHGNLCVPDENGKDEEESVWKVLTYMDHWVMDKACSYEAPRPDGKTQQETDYNEMRRLMVKRNLLSWSLDVPIVRSNGWMMTDCYDRVSRVFAPLMDAFISGFEDKSRITDKEEEEIEMQSAALFNAKGGIANACEAVSLFCTLGNYWEKFGLDKGKLAEIPYREYVMLKMMITRESSSVKSRSKSSHDTPKCKVVGPGGKVVPSRGTVIPM